MDWALKWRRQALPELNAVVGGVLNNLAVTHFRFATETLDHTSKTEVLPTSGLWISTDRAGLHIFNGLYENGFPARGWRAGGGGRFSNPYVITTTTGNHSESASPSIHFCRGPVSPNHGLAP